MAALLRVHLADLLFKGGPCGDGFATTRACAFRQEPNPSDSERDLDHVEGLAPPNWRP